MKLLLALNYKFIEKDAYQLVKLLEEYDPKRVIKGYEMMIDFNDPKSMEYFDHLAHISKEKGYLLQVHSTKSSDLDFQKRFLDKMEAYALFLEYPLNIVFHPVSDENDALALEKTNYLMGELLIYNYQKGYHLTLSLENLEHRPNKVRLDKDDIVPVFYNNIDLKYTYDLGHEFKDFGQITDVDHLLLERLNNVHLFRNDLNLPHLPLTEDDPDKEKWVKALLYLKQSGYEGSVVLEYDFYQMEGATFDEKFKSYVNHALFLKDYME